MTGKLDAFEWRVPMERLGQLIEQDDDEPEADRPALAPPRSRQIAPKPIEAEDAGRRGASRAAPAGDADRRHVATPMPRRSPRTAVAAMPWPTKPTRTSRPEPVRLPDDPGVDPDDEQEKSPRRFRLF